MPMIPPPRKKALFNCCVILSCYSVTSFFLLMSHKQLSISIQIDLLHILSACIIICARHFLHVSFVSSSIILTIAL